MELIDRNAVLKLPRNVTKNLSGEVIEETIDVDRIKRLPSVQHEIILCKDCRYSEYDSVFNTRYCHNKGKAEMVGDNFFCAAGRSETNESDR